MRFEDFQLFQYLNRSCSLIDWWSERKTLYWLTESTTDEIWSIIRIRYLEQRTFVLQLHSQAKKCKNYDPKCQDTVHKMARKLFSNIASRW